MLMLLFSEKIKQQVFMLGEQYQETIMDGKIENKTIFDDVMEIGVFKINFHLCLFGYDETWKCT